MQEAFCCDQDTINGILKGRILPLSPRYNFFTNYRYFQYNTLVQLCDAYRAVGKKEFAAAKRKPVIIIFWEMNVHGSGGNHNHYGKWYRKYLAMTHGRICPCRRENSGICSFGGASTRSQEYVRHFALRSAGGWE